MLCMRVLEGDGVTCEDIRNQINQQRYFIDNNINEGEIYASETSLRFAPVARTMITNPALAILLQVPHLMMENVWPPKALQEEWREDYRERY